MSDDTTIRIPTLQDLTEGDYTFRFLDTEGHHIYNHFKAWCDIAASRAEAETGSEFIDAMVAERINSDEQSFSFDIESNAMSTGTVAVTSTPTGGSTTVQDLISAGRLADINSENIRVWPTRVEWEDQLTTMTEDADDTLRARITESFRNGYLGEPWSFSHDESYFEHNARAAEQEVRMDRMRAELSTRSYVDADALTFNPHRYVNTINAVDARDFEAIRIEDLSKDVTLGDSAKLTDVIDALCAASAALWESNLEDTEAGKKVAGVLAQLGADKMRI